MALKKIKSPLSQSLLIHKQIQLRIALLTPVPSSGATPEEWIEDSTGQAGQAKDAKNVAFCLSSGKAKMISLSYPVDPVNPV
jgi:hypothetical protein